MSGLHGRGRDVPGRRDQGDQPDQGSQAAHHVQLPRVGAGGQQVLCRSQHVLFLSVIIYFNRILKLYLCGQHCILRTVFLSSVLEVTIKSSDIHLKH